jgi:aspartokinase
MPDAKLIHVLSYEEAMRLAYFQLRGARGGSRAGAIVRDTFEGELEREQNQRVEVAAGCSILTVVDDGMAGTPGVGAKAFASLANVGVNVRAIA